MLEQKFADRIRQGVQGCTIHLHGPVQTWRAIMDAEKKGLATKGGVLDNARDACRTRLADLVREGAAEDDPRVVKEKLTLDFLENLLR